MCDCEQKTEIKIKSLNKTGKGEKTSKEIMSKDKVI